MTIEDRINQLEKYDKAYRFGTSICTDEEYDNFKDALLADLPEDHELQSAVGFIPATRKANLPVKMYSMNKVKTFPAYYKWLKVLAKNLDITYEEVLELDVVLGPKLDGISIAQREDTKEAWTRGDGVIGQTASSHLVATGANSDLKRNIVSYGEAIFMKATFDSKWLGVVGPSGNPYKNGRNTVAGKFNADDPELPIMSDIEYIRYGYYDTDKDLDIDKNVELDEINEFNKVKFPYELCKMSDITEDYCNLLFDKWKKLYEIDGIVVDINDHKLRKLLGREVNNNPAYARALKFSFEEVGHSYIENIDWQVSKHGELYPTANIVPIELEGTTVKRAALYNAAHMEANGILEIVTPGVGSKTTDLFNYNTSCKGIYLKVPRCRIDIIKSGQVIPKVIKFNPDEINPSIFPNTLKDHYIFNCPECGSDIKWDKNHIHICCTNPNCSGKVMKEILGFFEIVKLDGFSEKTLEKLYYAGFESTKAILEMTREEITKIKGLGNSFADKLLAKQKSLMEEGLPLNVLMHASNKFPGLGSKKLLIILENYKNYNKPNLEEMQYIHGIGEESAKTYVDNYDDFIQWSLNVAIKAVLVKPKVVVSNYLADYVVCFTGCRDKALKEDIEAKSGKVASGYSKKTTHLIVADVNEKLTKIEKAKQDIADGKSNVVICTIEEFKNLINE